MILKYLQEAWTFWCQAYCWLCLYAAFVCVCARARVCVCMFWDVDDDSHKFIVQPPHSYLLIQLALRGSMSERTINLRYHWFTFQLTEKYSIIYYIQGNYFVYCMVRFHVIIHTCVWQGGKAERRLISLLYKSISIENLFAFRLVYAAQK